ncbi:putative DNA-binding domain-containing protein [Ciceribacter sp. L1K23]|uniref:HvfC/BufC N-terminal domain-containing protein n=1 Tax=Ciceribacter sp. L1K23 TaxID=2820276 RepID=UPI001B8218FF|nr:DNA-binding domain-containing protein [Ciceribacter sp. L1K23]MBR0556538.1 putative DNA-binding domain-containing protein [Ciceribacter sp. L1K23]
MSTATQERFAAALTDRESPVPEGLTSWTAPRPERRFGVYRNNVRVGLTGALASRFPATERIVGADFFAAMAGEYVAADPPRSPLLLTYGDGFADFVAGFEPVAGLPYLPDVIRLEAARSRAYHAADAAPLVPERLAAIPPERLGDIRLQPHPSTAILRSPHPVVTIWAMNAEGGTPHPVETWIGEDALVVRPAMLVEVHRLPPGGATFLSALAEGEQLGMAATLAMAETDQFDLTRNLAGLLTTGAFTDILPEDDHDA